MPRFIELMVIIGNRRQAVVVFYDKWPIIDYDALRWIDARRW